MTLQLHTHYIKIIFNRFLPNLFQNLVIQNVKFQLNIQVIVSHLRLARLVIISKWSPGLVCIKYIYKQDNVQARF